MQDFVIVNCTSRRIESEARLLELFNQHNWVRVDFTFGRARSIKQNSMAFELYNRISLKLYGRDISHARAECKLQIGVPLARRDIPTFRESYDATLKLLDYETKLKFIKNTDLPVTSLLSVKAMGEYIDQVIQKYSAQGVYFEDLMQEFGGTGNE